MERSINLTFLFSGVLDTRVFPTPCQKNRHFFATKIGRAFFLITWHGPNRLTPFMDYLKANIPRHQLTAYNSAGFVYEQTARNSSTRKFFLSGPKFSGFGAALPQVCLFGALFFSICRPRYSLQTLQISAKITWRQAVKLTNAWRWFLRFFYRILFFSLYDRNNFCYLQPIKLKF